MNLVSMIMQFLAPALVGKIASSLGINQALAQKVLAAAVPVILAGLAGRASQPAGAGLLSDILGKQDPGLLGKLAGVIGGAQQKQIADQGASVLGSLLGNSALGSLTGALTKFTGVGDAPAKGMLGLLAPVVLGTLAQQQKSSGLDAAGLARMLMGQKDNIAAAIPADFAKLLGGTGLLDSIGGAPAAAKPTATGAPASPQPTPGPSYPPAAQATRASAFNWWPWLIAIALAGAAWWALFANPRSTVASIPAAPRVMVGTSDVGSQVETQLKGLQGLLASIKDPQSAQNALPKLRETQTALDTIGGMPNMSADAKRQIAAYVAQWLPTLTPMITSLLGNSAIAPLVKPVLDNLTRRLEAMAKA